MNFERMSEIDKARLQGLVRVAAAADREAYGDLPDKLRDHFIAEGLKRSSLDQYAIERAEQLRDGARDQCERRTAERDRALMLLDLLVRSKVMLEPLDWVRDVTEFQTLDIEGRAAAGAPAGHPILTRPALPSDESLAFRRFLITSEIKEFEDAVDDRDLVEIADALADIVYVIIGTALVCGIPLHKVWAEVHRTNMAKFADGGSWDANGKLKKPEGWVPPDVAGILAQAAKVEVDDG